MIEVSEPVSAKVKILNRIATNGFLTASALNSFSARTPPGELTALPDPIVVLREPYFQGEGKGREMKESVKKGMEREWEGRGWEVR